MYGLEALQLAQTKNDIELVIVRVAWTSVNGVQDLRERMEPTRNVPRYSNALNPNRVHSNRHALFWCESRYFEATHIVPEALTATYNAHTHAAHTSRLAAAHTQLGTEAERLGATAGRPGGAAGGGIDESGAVAPMLGLRKRARVSDADNGGEGGDGTSEGDQKRQRSGSQKRSKAGKSKAKAKGVAACQNADPQVAEGDVGEVWVNAFVVGSGADRQVCTQHAALGLVRFQACALTLSMHRGVV